MRRYEAVWLRLKEKDRVVTQIVHPKLVDRVKKGVIKEKDRDLAFKVMNEDDPFRLEISYDRDLQRLTFKLVQQLGVLDKVMACSSAMETITGDCV